MSSTKIIQYIHRPNMTELGLGNTHETYMLVDTKTDMSEVFPPGKEVTVVDPTRGNTYNLKSTKNSEFRINQMGSIYRDYNVKPGDEIVITHFNTDGDIKNVITVRKYNRVGISVNGSLSEIVNLERLNQFSDINRTYSFNIIKDGVEKKMNIKYLESKKKRSDSPSETDYYEISLGGTSLPNGKYFINLDDELTIVPKPPKSEFNKVIIDDTPFANPKRVSQKDLQLIYYGAPGTGKSYEIDHLTKEKEVIRTTFHPDSDYSTFVGAYKPTSIEVPLRDLAGHKVIDDQTKEPVKENRIVYEFVEQAFLQAYTKAWKAYTSIEQGQKPDDIYLIIEEINRGNCAQIFGDLFQLLDRNYAGFSDYPINADKDLKKQLAKAFNGLVIADFERINSIYKKDVVSKVLSGDILLLPDNLYIWATMNTSDQSLFPIDSAFKRRWDWKYIPISEGKDENGVKLGWKIKVKDNLYDWCQFMEKINKEIGEMTKSEDKKIGYFFCKADDDVISAETFVSKVIFYLWNDVFKDQDVSNIFSDGEDEMSFGDFYDVNALGKPVIKEDKIEVFLKNLGLVPIENMPTDDNNIDDDEDTDTNSTSKRTDLIITFNGNTINGKDSIDRFANAIEEISVVEVASLGLKVGGYDLLSQTQLPPDTPKGYGNSMRKIRDYWLITKISNQGKASIIKKIADKLGLELYAEIKQIN